MPEEKEKNTQREIIHSTDIPSDNVQELIEKYDAESRYRHLGGLPGKLIAC